MFLLWVVAALADPLDDPLRAPVGAAPGRIEAQVKERGSGRVLPCEVLLGDEVVATCDDEGRFALELPPGSHDLLITSWDHAPAGVREAVSSRSLTEVVYRLEPQGSEYSIVVYDDGPQEYLARRVISADELRVIPGAMGDPIRALQSLPGVARPSGLEGAIVVRGAEAMNTGMYIDDMPVPFLFHMFVGRSVVNPSVLEDVEFFLGGMPADYGDATQAIVNARTYYHPPEHGVHGRVTADLMDGGFGLTARQGPWSIAAGGRISWLSGLIGVVSQVASGASAEPDYRAGWVSPYYGDYNLRLTRRVGDYDLSLTAVGARDELRIVPARYDTDGDGQWDEVETDDDLPYDPNSLIDNQFHNLEVRLAGQHGEHDSRSRLMFGWSRQASLLAEFGKLSQAPELGAVGQFTLLAERWDRWTLAPELTVRGGARLMVLPTEVTSWRNQSGDSLGVITKDLRLQSGLWADAQVERGRWWVSPGMRLAVHRFADNTWVEPEPRVLARYDLSDTVELSAFAGRFTQQPAGHRTAEVIGNPDLPLMESWQSSVGVSLRPQPGLELEATTYATWMPHVAVVTTDVFVAPWADENNSEWSGNTAYLQSANNYEDVEGAAFGVELVARYRPQGKWFGWTGLTLSKALRFDEGRRFPGDYDTPVSFIAVGARDLGRGWNASGRFRLTSGQPYTPPDPSYNANGYWGAASLATNSERLPTFHALDLRVDKTWTGERAEWTWFVDVMNVYNRKNPMLPTFNSNYQRLVRDVYIPILPTTGLQVDF